MVDRAEESGFRSFNCLLTRHGVFECDRPSAELKLADDLLPQNSECGHLVRGQ